MTVTAENQAEFAALLPGEDGGGNVLAELATARGLGLKQRIEIMAVDETTFEEIVNAHHEALYRFAFSLAHSEAEARDLTQETYHQFARKGHQLRDRSKVKTWLSTTLYRAFLDSRRWQTRYPHVEVGAVENELPVSLPAAADKMDFEMARQALFQIDEVYRAPLILFYLEEHSYLEIAEILGIPAGTVMSRISRGRAKLRQLLAETGSLPTNLVPLEPFRNPLAS